MVSGREKRAGSPTREGYGACPNHRDGATVSISGPWINHSPRRASQRCDAPSLGSGELPCGFSEFPSWPLPITPRTVLADAWRGVRDVRQVNSVRAYAGVISHPWLRPWPVFAALTGQPIIADEFQLCNLSGIVASQT